MPVSFDTRDVFRFVFSPDRDKLKPPTLLFHYPSVRESRQFAAMFDAPIDDPDKRFDAQLEAVKFLLTGWENFGIPYDPANLDSILTMIDLSDIRVNLLGQMSQSEIDKKKAAYCLPSNADNSAKPAETLASA